MRAQVAFPSCWDGKNLDNSDHKSRMAYPLQNYNIGHCPKSHPKAIFTIFTEFLYDTSGADVGTLVWAHGDKEGYGLHTDFVNGWTDQGMNSPDCSIGPIVGAKKPQLDFRAARDAEMEEDLSLNKAIDKLPGNNPVTKRSRDIQAVLWCFLFLGAILASGTVADNAHEVEDASNLGTVTKAYIDPDTHKVFVADVSQNKSSAVQERSYNTGNTQNTDTIVKILKKYNGYGYCKAACAGYSPEPVTQTEYKTVTKSTYTTKTIVPNPVKTTSTATAAAPPANTVAITITESTTIDVTETAEPSTITSTISTTSTLTETSTTTITSVVQLPTAPSVKKRGQSPPSYLRGYASHLICPACSQAWPKPKSKTVTLCKTTTKIATITRTWTKAAQTQTAILTITPAAGTETSTAINVQTLTNTVTSTPTETDTITLTATTTTIDVATSTVSACAQQTNGIAGISVSGSGSHLVGSSANTVVDCCTACYNAATGCSEWAFLGSGLCFYAVNNDATGAGGTCPNGLGTGTLLTGGPDDLAGGPGPCHS